MSRRRIALTVGGSVAAMLLLAAVSAVLIVRSQWFFDKVRLKLITTIETATGGRVEIGAFRFDWTHLRAEVDAFTLHGNEPADKPPLFSASSISLSLRIISILKRDIDLQSLEVDQPHIYLIVYPDGSTNLPAPKIKTSDRSPVETLLNLAIKRFEARNGVFEVESRGSTPFDARGERLDLKLAYEIAVPRYFGQLSIQPLHVRWPGLEPVALGVTSTFGMEKNRVALTSVALTTGASRVDLSGSVEDLASPRLALQYDARVAVADVARIARVRELVRGTIATKGAASWSNSASYSASGTFTATGLEYRDTSVRIVNIRADGKVTADPRGIDASAVRFSGATGKIAASGRVAEASLRGRNLDLRRIVLEAEGGTFQGNARLRDLDRFTVDGVIANFDAKRTVALYSPQPLPWDALAGGTVKLEGSLRRKKDLKASGELNITPAPTGTPVTGHIAASYEARSGLLELGPSTLTLPNSNAEFSGTLPGKLLYVHLETRNLDDILPVLGSSAADLPVKLESGAAVFDGTVAGDLDNPQIAGHVTTGGVSYQGRSVDSFQADVTASPSNVELKNGAAARGTLRAQFQGTVGLFDWKTDDASAIAGSGTINNADLKSLAEIIEWKDMPATGSLNAAAQVSGTIGAPAVNADLDMSKGVFQDEPFDRFRAHVSLNGRTVQLLNGRLDAGPKQVELAATFQHAPGRWDAGRVHFQVHTNVMELDQIQTAQKLRPGVKGTIEASGTGDLDVVTPQAGKTEVHVADLHADLSARTLQLGAQRLGDAHVTAESQNGVLKGHIESNFAGASILGDGEWRLEGQYPGAATLHFSKLDLARLPQWLSSGSSARSELSGVAEGEVRITGPLLEADQLKAELRIPKIEMSAVTAAPGGSPRPFAIQSSGPIVATLANKVVTVESARFVGTATDLSVTGKVNLGQKNPLDLRVNGKLDLSIIHEFNSDLNSSGSLVADATIRGPIDAPQLNGRVQFQNADFSVADLPNGISKASGVVVLTNEHDTVRATIQNFTGETGGGKIELTGFAGYGGGDTIFRLHANVKQVRVRYPEGVSTVANANLTFTGTNDRSQLSGTITIVRIGINLQSDFSSIIASSAEPVRTPAARTGLLGGLNFDVQIETSPDIQLQSSLAEDLEAEANLRLKGTFSNPALLGRVNITQGQITFFGTKYTINDGSIAFYNPLKIEPVLDISLQTKARGIEITLNVAGPLNKLHLTPRSDPPLQFNEIVALLATGRTPTSDPAMLTQQNTAPQSWQQMGATALLGQAIANPVSGRLQRFFGVSRLRIDPTITGVENNPQARLTLEQQVTPDITFTYITVVTSTNPQIVRMEWAFSKQWSVVALREENGTFGMDFFYRRRF